VNFIEDTIFPHSSDSLRKECNIALKTSPGGSKTTFLPIKLQQSIIQAAMYAASANNHAELIGYQYITQHAIGSKRRNDPISIILIINTLNTQE